MIPLLHDFSGAVVLIFGGGRVGARKARRFAREARTIVVSPVFTEADFGDAKRIRAAPTPERVGGWFDRAQPALAVAATDRDDVNDAIARAARERGVLLNRADWSAADDNNRTVGDVTVPATVRDDPVLLAVATDGNSPALSRYLRECFETEFAGAGTMAELSGELREELKSERSPETRRRAMRAVVRSERVWKALGTGKSNGEHEARSVIGDILDGENP